MMPEAVTDPDATALFTFETKADVEVERLSEPLADSDADCEALVD